MCEEMHDYCTDSAPTSPRGGAPILRPGIMTVEPPVDIRNPYSALYI